METDRIIRLPQVLDLTGVSASTVARWERSGDFPRRLRIGARTVGWRLSNVKEWIEARVSSTGTGGSDDSRDGLP